MKLLDKPNKRCDDSEDDPFVSKCVTGYIDSMVNCSTGFLMGNEGMPPCDYEQFTESAEFARNHLQFLHESGLINVTGCLPGCEQSNLDMKMLFESSWNDYYGEVDHRVLLRFKILDSQYDIVNEYYIYDETTLLADVGGFLGLFLGTSIYGIYVYLVERMSRFKIRAMVDRFKKASAKHGSGQALTKGPVDRLA